MGTLEAFRVQAVARVRHQLCGLDNGARAQGLGNSTTSTPSTWLCSCKVRRVCNRFQKDKPCGLADDRCHTVEVTCNDRGRKYVILCGSFLTSCHDGRL